MARADVIALARLSVPRDGKGGIAGENGFARIAIRPERVLKGSLPAGLAVRYYLGSDLRYVKKETLLALDGRPVVVFLVLSTDGSYHPALYFESEQGVEPAAQKRIAQIEAEIARQKDVLVHWRADPALKDFAIVKALMDKTTTPNGATQAFKDLEALGREGVPAMIAQMDDRRDLGVQQIELVNPPNSWEGIRHYGPKKVVDVLSVILSQVTAEDFGFIENGGSEEERLHAVEGWHIYDDVLRNHPAALKN